MITTFHPRRRPMLEPKSMSVKAKNNAARSVLFGLLGTSAILVAAAMYSPKLTGLIWMVALGFITATIYVYNRHVGSEYYYDIGMDGGKESLVVSMRVGKTLKTLARLDISSVTEVRRMTRKEFRSHKCERGVFKYPYFPTMFPTEVYLVSVRSEFEKIDLFLELNEDFAKALIGE